MILVLSPLLLFDLQNIINHPKKPVPLGPKCDDYTILVPLFGDPKYFKNKEHLNQYKEHVVLCINVRTKKMLNFANKCKKDGFRVFKYKGEVKSPWHFYKVALNDQLILLKRAIPNVVTKYTIFLDGDSYFTQDPAKAVGALEKNKLDITSVKILPTQRKTLIQKLQGVEYDVAMYSRLSKPWLTSGACMIAKTKVIANIMSKHSEFFYGGDIEIGRQSFLSGKYKIGHLDFTVLTDVPSTFKQLFKQRIGWWAGAFRTIIINFDTALKSPLWFTYYFLVVWLLLPFKWVGLIYYTEIIPVVYFAYVAMTIVANWRVRSVYMLIFPFYSLFQALVMPPFGVYRYFKFYRQTGNSGRYATI